MSLLSVKDHDLVIKAINTFLDNNAESPERVEMHALRQWVALRKTRLTSDPGKEG